jgi:RNA polymerase sigma factor (sigma-70 family)
MDRARQKASVKHGGGNEPPFVPLDAPEMSADERLLLIEESLQQFERENPDDSRIVMLKFFAGLTNQEVADSLGVNEKTVRRKWMLAKARLFQILTEIEQGRENPPST